MSQKYKKTIFAQNFVYMEWNKDSIKGLFNIKYICMDTKGINGRIFIY